MAASDSKSSEKIKDKKGKRKSNSDSEGENEAAAGDSPPNLFCSLPTSKSPLPTQPIPLAFLHRIVAENKIKNGLPIEEFHYLEGQPNSNPAGSSGGSSRDGGFNRNAYPNRNGEINDRNGTLDSNDGMQLDGNFEETSSSGDSTLLAGTTLISTSRTIHSRQNSNSTPSTSVDNSNSSSISSYNSHIDPAPPPSSLPVEGTEAPWFSQLASLSHLRSAGIPPVSPDFNSKLYKSKERGGLFGVGGNKDGRPNTSSGSGITRNNSPTHPSSISVQSSPGRSINLEMRPRSANDFSFGLAAESSLETQTSSPKLISSTTLAIPKPIPISQALNLSPTENLDEPLLPPDNFSMVNTWVYRSSFPKKKHFPFLKSLGLRSVL